ncbi:MAG: transcription termination/antitermination protein NusG [Holosporaceae bacterium]|nr:transcription termination/antitermination protein NusG [Holosporaceae bacterium]
MKWYVVNVYSGFEQRVLESIFDRAKRQDLSHMFGKILIPSEEVIEIKKGEKIKSNRKFFPGYILVQMILTDETWHLVRSTSKVSNFLGARGKPHPMSNAEVDHILKRAEDSANNVRHIVAYEVGDSVRICDGPFATLQGTVEEVDHGKERVKVSVLILSRPINVDLGYTQIEKLS